MITKHCGYMIERHGFKFSSESQANNYFSKNPIKANPVVIFKSRQAAIKWLPMNQDLIPSGSGIVIKTVEGHKVSLTIGVCRSFLSQDEKGKYYWSLPEIIKKDKPKEKMGANSTLFNSHKNKADKRVKEAFLEFFGQGMWDNEIEPFIKDGTMGMLAQAQNDYTKFYVWAVWLIVNKF